MVVIRIKKDPDTQKNLRLGEWICEALKGNKAFIDSDILVNYDLYSEYIIICLGENNDHDICLDVGWPYPISRPVQRGREEENK